MTLLLSGVSEQFGIVLSDRRVTANGKLVDDEVNKTTAYFCSDAKLVLTYTGLARAGSYDTGSWIQNFLVHNSKPEREWFPVRRRLVAALQDEIKRIKAPPSAKRLSILATGYQYRGGDGAAVLTRIGNFEEGTPCSRCQGNIPRRGRNASLSCEQRSVPFYGRRYNSCRRCGHNA
jgi:hypothetical protein